MHKKKDISYIMWQLIRVMKRMLLIALVFCGAIFQCGCPHPVGSAQVDERGLYKSIALAVKTVTSIREPLSNESASYLVNTMLDPEMRAHYKSYMMAYRVDIVEMNATNPIFKITSTGRDSFFGTQDDGTHVYSLTEYIAEKRLGEIEAGNYVDLSILNRQPSHAAQKPPKSQSDD